MFVHVTTTVILISFEKVLRSIIKECNLTFVSKACDLDPIPAKLSMECLDSVLGALIDLFYTSHVSGVFL